MRILIIAAASTTAFAWWITLRRAGIETAEDEPAQETGAGSFDFLSANPFQTFQDAMAPAPDNADQNTAAFLMMIRTAEGTAGANGYRTMFGGKLFNDWADHPRQAQRYGQLWTSAAGAYQFMAVSAIPGGGYTKINTWDRIKKRLGLEDFSPDSQDAAAVELIREAGALGDVRAGRFDAAVSKVKGIWASLPGAGYGQPEKRLADLRAAYQSAGGVFA